MRACRSKWVVPAVSVALGLVMLAAEAVAHHLGQGLISLGIMVAFGAVFLFGGRSETIRGLRGDGSDERFVQMDMRASWLAGMVMLFGAIAGFIVETARGHEDSPFTWLCALFGASYLAAIVVQRVRS